MKIEKITFKHDGQECCVNGQIFEECDKQTLTDFYFSWKKLNEVNTIFNVRRINLPELLSEGLVCLLMNFVRTNAVQIDGLQSSSCDAINLKTGHTVQIKAASTKNKKSPGPTSFGPRSEFEELYFVHLDCDNDIFNIYDLSDIDYKKIMVNKTETIEDQAKMGKRPRVNILSKIIIPENRKPIYSYDFQ